MHGKRGEAWRIFQEAFHSIDNAGMIDNEVYVGFDQVPLAEHVLVGLRIPRRGWTVAMGFKFPVICIGEPIDLLNREDTRFEKESVVVVGLGFPSGQDWHSLRRIAACDCELRA